MKRTINLLAALSVLIIIAACNKEKKLLKGLVGSWKIEKSEIAILGEGGTDDVIETVNNAGKLVISDEDPENPSKEMKHYDFFVVNANNDTIKQEGTLLTDERNKRIILTKALSDSTYFSDIVWTIEEEKKNKQTWTTYGVDSVLFYPPNNNNPGNATNWIEWRIWMKRE